MSLAFDFNMTDLYFYGYISGSKLKRSFNNHIVQIRGSRDEFESASPFERFKVKVLSNGKTQRLSKSHLSLFDYTELHRKIKSKPGKVAPISLPGTAPLEHIVSILDERLGMTSGIPQIITEYLQISPFVMEEMKAVACSSDAGHFPLSECLTLNSSTWWISAESAPQFIEFQIARPMILKQIGLIIPPLPYGPLTVPRFAISYSVDGSFVEDSRVFETLDSSNMQMFALDPPIVLDGGCKNTDQPIRFRLVCKTSADPFAGSVGYFTIRFG